MNLILDLDSTLIYSNDTGEYPMETLEIYTKNHHLKKRIYHFQIDGQIMWGIYRPGVIEFIRWADDYFDNVIVWSAGSNKYVKEIVRVIWNRSGLKYPEIIYTFEKCSSFKTPKGTTRYYKDLDILFTDEKAITKNIFPHNTVILDDNLDTKERNLKNVVFIPPYEIPFKHDPIKDLNDQALHKVREWFSNLKNVKDIREINKEIF